MLLRTVGCLAVGVAESQGFKRRVEVESSSRAYDEETSAFDDGLRALCGITT